MYRRYPPANQCIYCGSREEPLTKEHIIAYSLGGNLVLPRASCSAHRDLTSQLEGRVAREMYGRYRDAQEIQTRHRSHREQRKTATVLLQGTTFDDQPCQISVHIRELPRLHVSVHLPVPQVVSGAPITAGSLGSFVKAQSDPSQMQALLSKLGLKTLTSEANIQIETFLRVLAKTAHAFVAAELGVGNFNPLLLPLIDGSSSFLLQYVGAESPERPQSKEALSLERITVRGDRYLAVDISLHAFPRLPRYRVVAGKQ